MGGEAPEQGDGEGIEEVDAFGTPRAADVIQAGDTLVLYSPIDRLRELDQRGVASGDSAHREAAAEHAAGTSG